MAKITYANKVTLNPQPSIADENKVTDDDMNEIKQVVNNNDDNTGDLSNLATNTKSSIVGAINELKNAEVYSTTEINTGNVWIDGKPLYRKVVEINNLNTNPYDYDISSLQAEWLEIENSQFEYNLNNTLYSWVGSVYNTTNDNIRIFRRGEVVRISYGSTQSSGTNKKVTLILKYTKTTD